MKILQRFFFLSCLAFLLSSGPFGAATVYAEDPVQVVQSVANNAMAKIGKGGSWSSRRSVAKKIVRSRFDAALIGRLSLGPYWKKATTDERKRYLKTHH